jgi:hypothetical protein
VPTHGRGLSLTPAVRPVTASRICSSTALVTGNAVLGSTSETGVNKVRKTAHVAFCGKYDALLQAGRVAPLCGAYACRRTRRPLLR